MAKKETKNTEDDASVNKKETKLRKTSKESKSKKTTKKKKAKPITTTQAFSSFMLPATLSAMTQTEIRYCAV